MQRNVSCNCSQLTIKTVGEPYASVMCHCLACQQRTGAPYGVGVYFKITNVEIEGNAEAYIRKGASGSDFINYFCRNCGTTVYWKTPFHKDAIGIAYGCFEGDSLPAPSRSVWESERHSWVDVPTEDRWIEGRNGPKV